LDGDLDDFVYDYYHSGGAPFVSKSFDRYHVRLPTNEELQLYFGGEEVSDGEEDTNDGDSDSNAENYHGNEYPDEGDFEGALENETTSSEDSYGKFTLNTRRIPLCIRILIVLSDKPVFRPLWR
jgi:hypothetical protein